MFLYTLKVLLVANMPKVLGHLHTEQFSGTTKSLGPGSRTLLGLGTVPHLQLGLGFSVAEGAADPR